MLPTLSPSALSLKHRNRFYFRTAALLALVGGRQPGALVLTAACAAHVGEAMIAHHNVATRLRIPGAPALAWCLLVLLVGFPVLRHVLALKASESKLHRA